MVRPLDRLTLDLPPTIDLPASLRPIGRWDDGIDRWDGRQLLRTLRLPGTGDVVAFAATLGGPPTAPQLRVQLERPVDPDAAAAAIGSTIASDPEALAGLQAVAADDAAVARLRNVYPGVLPVLFPDPFTALIRSISAQQVNLAWAAEVRRRLAARYGRRHRVGGSIVFSLPPDGLADAPLADLRALQLTTAKGRSVIACAQAAAAGRLARTDLERLGDGELIAHLTALPGIGLWSAEWFISRTLGRPRVVAGDLGVRKAVGRMYDAGVAPSEAEVRRLTAHWGPAATFIQALALHDLAVANRPAPPRPAASTLRAAPRAG